MGTSAQSGGSSGLMGTSAILVGAAGRGGLRKASKSGSVGTSGLLVLNRPGWRAHSGLIGTPQTGFRSELEEASSRILNGLVFGLTEPEQAALGGCSGLVCTSQPRPLLLEESVGASVWSLKDSAAGGGGCTTVMEVRPALTMVPCLAQEGSSRLTALSEALSSSGLCSMMGLQDQSTMHHGNAWSHH